MGHKQQDKLIIELEDLPADDIITSSAASSLTKKFLRVYPGAASEPNLENVTTLNFWFWPLVGGLAGFMGWLLVEILFPSSSFYVQPFAELLKTYWLSAVCPGGTIGLVMGFMNGIVKYSKKSRIINSALLTMVLGAAGGVAGGLLGQLLYMLLMEGGNILELVPISLHRTLACSVAGLFIGFAQGIASGQGKKMVAGMIAGLVGGAFGGALFDLMGNYVSDDETSRAVMFMALGILIGSGNGLVYNDYAGDR